MKMGNRCYEWTDEPWDRGRELMPQSRIGRPRKDDRLMVNAMLWLARSGAGWAYIPEGYGPWKTVYSRFCKWRDERTFLRIFEALNQDADMDYLSLDATMIQANSHSASAKKWM